MNEWWNPIAREGELKISPLRSIGEAEVEILLNHRPPAEWVALFKEGEPLPFAVQDDPLVMGGRGKAILRGKIAPEKFEVEIARLDSRIEHANQEFEARELPGLTADQKIRVDMENKRAALEADLKQRAARLARPIDDSVSDL